MTQRFFALNKLAPYETEYQCYQDCKISGCPGHKAAFRYFSVTDTYTINFGDEDTIHLDNVKFEMLLDFAKRLTDQATPNA